MIRCDTRDGESNLLTLTKYIYAFESTVPVASQAIRDGNDTVLTTPGSRLRRFAKRGLHPERQPKRAGAPVPLPDRASLAYPPCPTCHSERPRRPNSEVAQAGISMPKRPNFCDSPAFGGKKTCHRPPSSPEFPKKPPSSDTLGLDDTSALLQPLPRPYHITQRPNSNPRPGAASTDPMPTSQHREPPSPKPLTCPSIPPKTPPKPCH